MNQPHQFKDLYKAELASVYEISLPSLRMRLEAMEEDGVITRAWRRQRKLSSGIIAAYVQYNGEPKPAKLKLILIKQQ